jgi:hypothetical protein
MLTRNASGGAAAAGSTPGASATGEPTGTVPSGGLPGSDPRATALTPAIRTLVQRADGYYRAAMNAQRAGDWATYGEQIRLLGRTLTQLREAEQRRPVAPPTPVPGAPPESPR